MNDNYYMFVLALAVVLAALYIVVLVLKKMGIGQGTHYTPHNDKQLHLLETKSIDIKRKLIRVRNGETEHLILSGPHNDIMMESKPYKETKTDKK